MIYVGIDPGLDGALAAITPTGLAVYDAPTYRDAKGRRRYQIGMMANTLYQLTFRGPVAAVIEAVHAMPGQGVTSMFSMGYGLGLWHALLAAYAIPYIEVSPRRWKGFFVLDSYKDRSRECADGYFPGTDFFKRKKDHGRAEAALMAEYGRRQP